MWRSIFIAAGIMAVIAGVECMVIDSATFYSTAGTEAGSLLTPLSSPAANLQEWQPKEWFPWAFLSVGVITILYAFTLPKRFKTPAVE